MAEKKCNKCGELKDLKDFGPQKNSPDKKRYSCRICSNEKVRNERRLLRRNDSNYRERRNAYSRAYGKKRRSDLDYLFKQRKYGRLQYRKHRKSQKEREVRKTFGIGLIDYESLRKEANGVCFLCGEPESETNILVLDHGHLSKRIRKFIHRYCNVRLQAVEDSQFLKRALEYLRKFDKIDEVSVNRGL